MSTTPPQLDAANPRLTFEDDFSNFTSSPDGSQGWMTTYPYPGAAARTLASNKEAEYYSDASVGVNPFSDTDGVLTIQASPATPGVGTPAGSGLSYTSGLITTYKSFSQLYGTFAVTAKLPAGQGFWPAFWLLPTNGTWPPELDVFEQLGGDASTIYETAHTDDGGFNTEKSAAATVPTASTAFHTYSVDWEPDTITWSIDGQAVAQIATPSDMHTPMYMLLNLGVGGAGSWPGPADGTSSASLAIDDVKVYAPSEVSAPLPAPDAYAAMAGNPLAVSVSTGVLGNDIDQNALSLSASLAPDGGPQHGSLQLNADGSFVYTPDAGYAGPDGFAYVASDGLSQAAPTLVSLAVAARAPLARPDASSVWAGHVLTNTTGVLANDVDQNGLALTATLAPNGGPQHGSLQLNADGTYVYVPAPGFAGTDSFSYLASDGLAQSTGTATITVTSHAPTTRAASYQLAPNQAFNGSGLLLSDSDANGLALTTSLAPNGGPQHGSLQLNSDGSFVYMPDAGYVGSDSFAYVASDSLSQSAPTSVSLMVAARAPLARPDASSVWAGHVLTNTTGVLANDVDQNGLALTAALAPNGGPQHGTLQLNPDGTYVYVPAPGFAGTDSFSYLASDGLSQSAGMVTITVAFHAPTTRADSYQLAPNQAFNGSGLLLNDSDANGLALTASLSSGGGPQHGSLQLNTDGSFVYTPAAGYVGSDSFAYVAGDTLSQSAPTNVSLMVAARAPLARPDASSVWAGHVLTNSTGVLANDVDQNGLSLTAALAPNGGPQHGILQLNPNGSYVYTPAPGFAGTDSFSYVASDGLAQSTGTATITVVPHAPTTRADAYQLAPNQALNGSGLLQNDTDSNGLALSASLAPNGSPDHGSLQLNPDGSFVYTPDAGYVGSDTFAYVASDGLSQSPSTSVSLSVVAKAPITHQVNYAGPENQSLSVPAPAGVLANDVDQNGLALAAALAPNQGPLHGSLSLARDGSFVYTAAPGYTGWDSFAYVASDTLTQSSPVLVSIHTTGQS